MDLHPYTIDVLSERLGLDGNHRLDIEAIRQRQVFQFSGDRFGSQFVLTPSSAKSLKIES